jgi:hypothetical protein
MHGMTEWAKDLLLTRGALVEMEDADSLRAMLPAELAAALESSEWLSLRFGAGPGSDDEGEWLERLARLLPADARVAGARLRRTRPAASIDPVAAMDRHLVIQNGVHRLLDHGTSLARYYFFTFGYSIESDETSFGVRTACLNATAGSLVIQAESLLHSLRDEIEDDPGAAIPRPELARLFQVALRGAYPEIRRAAAGAEQNANRRLARDAERLHAYYRDLLQQIGKRIARRGSDAAAAEKERNRAAATQLDRAAKLEDLVRKYSLKIRVEPGDVLAVSLPVVEIAARVIRKKAERTAKFHWNPALRILESPWCEACCSPADPLFLCDDRVHFLCRTCLTPCPHCGRQVCRVCQPKCKCGGGAARVV